MAGLKDWWRAVRPGLLSAPISAMAKVIGSTLRLETPGREKALSVENGLIVAGWHGKSFVATRVLRDQGFYVLISLSNDGEMQKRIFSSFGFQIIRGSTGRGGAKALIESIKALKQGGKMALTPDGPRGPSGVVQEGMMMMAQKSGAALIPVGISSRWRWLAPTWDKYMVPLPFSKAIMIFGDPIYVPAKATPEEVEEIRLALQAKIHELESEAERKMGRIKGLEPSTS